MNDFICSKKSCFLHIEPPVLDFLSVLYKASEVDRLERGCILVGRYSDDGRTAVVESTECLLVGSEYSLIQTAEYAAEVCATLKSLWGCTDGRMFYLGEWHSHPRQLNIPSYQDVCTCQARASDENTHCPEMLMLISGSNGLGAYLVTASDVMPFEAYG